MSRQIEGFHKQPIDTLSSGVHSENHMLVVCRHFGREIAAYDIQTRRCDVYGQGEGYSEQAMLIYDGLHYDALAVAAFQDAPEELDVTITETSSSHLPAVQRAAAALTSQVVLPFFIILYVIIACLLSFFLCVFYLSCFIDLVTYALDLLLACTGVCQLSFLLWLRACATKPPALLWKLYNGLLQFSQPG